MFKFFNAVHIAQTYRPKLPKESGHHHGTSHTAIHINDNMQLTASLSSVNLFAIKTNKLRLHAFRLELGIKF